MRIRKAVILAAGLGTRFLPATKAQPKEMLPLVDKPLIQYSVEEAVASGIDQIIIVIAGGKGALVDHFDRSFELEQALEQKGDYKRLEEVRRISDLAEIAYIRQKEQLGVGHAVLAAQNLVGNEPFALYFPDDVIDGPEPALKQMMAVYEQHPGCVLAVQEVPRDELSKYGVIAYESARGRIYPVTDLVEKPDPAVAPSNLGIVGRYILTPDIFDAIKDTPPGVNREIQLTDGIQRLLRHQAVYGYQFEGTRYDAGTPLGFLKASVDLALKREDLAPQFREYLMGLGFGQPASAARP